MKELQLIQTELKAPKGKYNSFGKYAYRSCEDILEAVKPLLAKHKCTITISDDIVVVGERYYIKAIATITNDSGEQVLATGFARESLEKKGMDDAQITGSASSYARKYALNGLLAIDDNKDADSTNISDKDDEIISQLRAATSRTELINIYNKNKATCSKTHVMAVLNEMSAKFPKS